MMMPTTTVAPVPLARVLLLLLALMLSISAEAARVALPKWASSYTRSQPEQAAYIADDDQWVVVYSEVIIGRSPQGGVRQTWRQVLAAVGEERQPLVLGVGFDDASQTLEGPQVWVPGGVGYGALNLDRASVEVPSLQGSTLTADRTRFIRTKPIKPGRRNVVAEWVIDDRDAFPGELLLLPLSPHPMVEWRVRAESDEVSLTLLQGDELTEVTTQGVTLRQVPASQYLLQGQGNWSGSPVGGIPTIHASVLPPAQQTWSALSERVTALFEQAVSADEQRSYETQARELVAGASSDQERVVRLAAFAQSLAYRDVQWGIGAYLPQSPAEVLRSRTADCKGKTVLLQSLLATVGIRSVPVLVSIQDRYLELREPATAFAFNHVVLAVDVPGNEALPGRLASGPGAGWVLFDPTDSLATFGQPVRGLAGTLGLWLDDPGTLFQIEPRAPAAAEGVALAFSLDEDGNATFQATLTGPSTIAELASQNSSSGELTSRIEGVIGRSLASALPGLEVQSLILAPSDHLAARPQQLTITGRIPDVLLPLAGPINTLKAPAVLIDQLVSLDTRPATWIPPETEVTIADDWKLAPCCFASDYRLEVTMELSMPQAWSLKRAPTLDPVSSVWLEASAGTRVAEGDQPFTWALQLALHRGAFPELTGEERTAQLNAVTKVMREPFLVTVSGR